jgi:hypothetical protein
MNSIESPLVTIHLSAADHEVAMEFAKQHPTPQRGKTIYLNTLAIQAVHHYLNWFGINSNLAESDAWSLPGQLLSSTADLVIPNIGTLECCPLLPNQDRITLPMDALNDRLGYIAVQFNEQIDRVELRGFFPLRTEIAPPEIRLTDFQPIETLFESLEPETVLSPIQRGAAIVNNLSQWLQNLAEPGWQTLEELITQGDFNLAFARSPVTIDREDTTLTVSRFRAVDLGLRLNYQPLILSVSVTPLNDREREVVVKVRPSGTQIYLPQGLRLGILDETEAAIANLQEIAQDDYSLMQLTFTGELHEAFQLRLDLESELFQLPFVI